MKKILFLGLLALLLGLAYIAFSDYEHDNDTIYFGGNILTMNDAQPSVEAMYVKDGKILALGATDEVLKWKNKSTQIVDLKGKTLMPGFFDPHGHCDLAAVFYAMTDVSGVTYRQPEIVWGRIEQAVKQARKDQWVYIYGFDPILTQGVKTPTLHYLDSIAPDKPLVILTKALHVFYANSKAFAMLGINHKTSNPSKASYYERDSLGQLTGGIVEQEALEPFRQQIQKDVMANFVQNTQQVLSEYAKMGVTSVVNMGLSANKKSIFTLYQHIAASRAKPVYQLLAFIGKLPEREPSPRLFLYLRKENLDLLPDKTLPTDDAYKIIGVKMWYDGSPYSGSMYLRQAYIQSDFTVNGINLSPNHTSHSLLEPAELQSWIQKVQAKGYPVAIHAQGDIANDEVLDVCAKIHATTALNPYRHRLEHCMLLPAQRLLDMQRMSISPSFHINHLLYYGDFLDESVLGAERASRIFPVQSTVQVGLPYSLHADMPQFVPNPLVLASTSVNRMTERGTVYNAAERVSVLEALKSITIHAAWQVHMDDKLGSLEKGKYADLVILDKNPMSTASTELGKIQVLETIVAGNRVWKR